MSVKVEKIEKNILKLEIEVSAERFEEGLQSAYKKNLNKFSVPGFRKGKVPRNIVERHYGEGVLYEDAVDYVYPDAYRNAIKENDIDPVDFPKLDILEIGKGKKLVFTAEVTIKPDFELGQYKNVEIEKKVPSVTDEQIEAALKQEQERNARVINVEDRPAKNGDICKIDFEGFKDGVPFDGGKGENHELTLGSGSFIPGFEEQLIGKEIGTEFEIEVTFPEEYHEKSLAGQLTTFKVKINEIKEKDLPKLDDDFAKDVSEFDTIEEYKKSIKDKLFSKAEEENKNAMEMELLDKIADNTQIDIPKVMIENGIDSLIRDFDTNLRYQGLDLQKYLQILNLDMASMREKFAERAQKQVKLSLIIGKITKVENIVATEEDFEKQMKIVAERYNDTYENIVSKISEDEKEHIIEELASKKTIEFLVDNAKYL